jgi:hypothetical protein
VTTKQELAEEIARTAKKLTKLEFQNVFAAQREQNAANKTGRSVDIPSDN